MTTMPPIQNFHEKEPYIFISYAAEDVQKVAPIVEKLQSDGFRLWYHDGSDESVTAKTIKLKMRRAMFFLAFLSPAYVQSVDCQKELQLAQEKDFSRCILIHLEKTKLDDALAFFYARAQNVRWYMSEDNEAVCYYVLYETGFIDKCNIHGTVPSIPLSSVYGEDSSASAPPKAPPLNTNRLKMLSFLIGAIGIALAVFMSLNS